MWWTEGQGRRNKLRVIFVWHVLRWTEPLILLMDSAIAKLCPPQKNKKQNKSSRLSLLTSITAIRAAARRQWMPGEQPTYHSQLCLSSVVSYSVFILSSPNNALKESNIEIPSKGHKESHQTPLLFSFWGWTTVEFVLRAALDAGSNI